MSEKEKKELPHFKTRARLLSQLGDQLIKTETIALMELVKNSYDADSPDCYVTFDNPDNPESGSITIEDSGDGMDIDILQNAWLEIGTNNKETKKKDNYKTPKFNRHPLGEKGIGRFGVHRLGRRIEIISKTKNNPECVLRINWDKIDESKYIEDFPIVLYENQSPKYFKDSTGTKIIITKLRNTWDRGTVREIARSINSLNSPFQSNDSFKTKLSINNDWLNGILSFDEIKDKSLYKFELEISGNQITDFSYDFTPYDELDKVSSRHLSYDDVKDLSRMINDKDEEIDISKYKIGNIRIEGNIFDLDNIILKLGVTTGKKELKDYLKTNGGIKVFRDNMRIWNYGESDNDWLELDQKRINRPSYKLSNHLVLIAVYLDGEKSTDLIEKTNREGFVENNAYQTFKAACSYAIDKVELFRNQDKEKLRGMYFSQSKKETPVLDSIEEIKEIVKKEIKDEQTSKDMFTKLDRISEDYTRITDSLIKSAGIGLNLISVIHQLDKLIKNIKAQIRNDNADEVTIRMVDNLSILIEGYSLLVRNSEAKVQPLNKIIDYAIENTNFRFIVHKIKIVEAYKNKELKAYASENYMINALMNLFDNSIWWLGYSKQENSKIYVDIREDGKDYISVIIADNGPGFGTMSNQELITPFISAKPTGIGMGIGLHLTNEIMEALKGRLIFPEPDDYVIPEEFKKGAIVVLSFRRTK